ncbi:Alpha/beta hydrolase fold [Parasponia andersonii]|uniref:Alpha/beta hydrolase fold n=1 Tax=Parasponia andersonii TaxID=3476 RepID=A0A2P5BCX8_PARAD|nr:Alpha/beta hydrolase fold [Parasponia andersonii]
MDVLCNHGGDIVHALNANVYGNGTQTVVLAHGFGSDQTVWYYLIPYLACYFKVLVYDLVFSANVDPKLYNQTKYSNFNGYTDDLICLLDELNVKNTIYVGQSMSAMIGCVASIKRPEIFQQVVLLSGSPRDKIDMYLLNGKGYNGGFERPQLNQVFKEIDEDFPNWVKSFAPAAVGVNITTAVTKFEPSLGRMKPRIALSVAKTVFLSDPRRILPRVSVPSFIIQSEKDYIVPKSIAFYIKRNLRGPAKVKILKTEGHFPQLTAYPMLQKVLKQVLHINR